MVRSTEILVYLVGGNPTLARMLLQWLKCADDDDMPLTSYVFDSASVTLKHQGSDANEHVTVNTRECMEYLIELADAKEMLSDALVSVHKDLWWKMAFTNEEVDLFDNATWSYVDYESLVDLIHQKNNSSCSSSAALQTPRPNGGIDCQQ